MDFVEVVANEEKSCKRASTRYGRGALDARMPLVPMESAHSGSESSRYCVPPFTRFIKVATLNFFFGASGETLDPLF
jgi:hypothetical protein